MREKLETLSLAVLKEFAKDLNIKNISSLRKSELIDRIVEAELKKENEKKDAAMKQESAESAKKTQTLQKKEHIQKSEKENARRKEAAEVKDGHTKREDKQRKTDKTEKAVKVSHAERGEHYHAEKTENTERTQQHTDRAEQHTERADQHAGRTDKNDKNDNHGRQEKAAEDMADGILEVLSEGYGFIRCENFLPGENDVYVSPAQIRKFNLKTGDIIRGPKKVKTQNEKFSALLYLETVNGFDPSIAVKRPAFESLTPIFPYERLHLEKNSNTVAMRMVDLISPIGKGQRGLIVSQPKSGKTTLLKQIATAVTKNNPEMHIMILLIDERPEEVTDIKESIVGDNVEVIYSTFDELPDRHRRVSEMVIERAKRLVEQKQDVIILLDSITRLARAYNLTVQASGRTLSGGLDPAALHMPKRFFGAARKMREGGSLTILATALVDTGSKMDDVVFEEFKGTGNMELVLDRKLSEKRVFPAIDIAKSGTRREDLLLDKEELEAVDIMRKALNSLKTDEAAERILNLFVKTRDNKELVQTIIKNHYV